MSSIVNLRTGLGPVLSLFGAKDRWTSPLIKARTVPTPSTLPVILFITV